VTALEAAKASLARGWMPIPIPHRSKAPTLKDWPQLRLSTETLPAHFDGQPQNIGVLLGEPSRWLVDVDLDHPRAVELASQFLPATPLMFGRSGKPRSHWLYRVTGPVVTQKHRSKSAGMIVELRSTGTQTVFPPSVHPSGEAIQWVDEEAEPAEIEPDELLAACKSLADAVKAELGEKRLPKTSRTAMATAGPIDHGAPPVPVPSPSDRYARCLVSMRRLGLGDKSDGSFRLFTAACRCVEHDLPDGDAIACIREYAGEHSFPRGYDDEEITQRLRDAEKRCQRGAALETEADGLVKLGTRDPATGRLVLSARRTLPTAEAFIRDFHTHTDGWMLRSYASQLMEWRGNRYVPLEDGTLKNRLQPWLHDALRYTLDKKTGDMLLVDFESNPSTVNAALDTLRHHVHLAVSETPPFWLESGDGRPDPREILSCRTLNLHIPTGTILRATPSLFTTSSLGFDYVPDAPAPVGWLAFLRQLWADDHESIQLLQDWLGYCLTPDTSQQKMLLLVGPRRSGKGTIGRVLTQLIGQDNVVGPTTSSLAGPFGLQPLIGKSLAIVSDARFTGESVATVTERLLCISGEDTLTVDRKHLPSVTMRLPVRFMFLTNELPRLSDASGALAGRFVVLTLGKTFYGQEDIGLTDRLLRELPGILLWALEGWLRLRQRGRFVQPSSMEDAIRNMEDLSSPVGAFVRERCDVGASLRVWVDDLYIAWREWCEQEGRNVVSTKQTFGRDLLAAVPGIICRRHSVHGRFYEGIGLVNGRVA